MKKGMRRGDLVRVKASQSGKIYIEDLKTILNTSLISQISTNHFFVLSANVEPNFPQKDSKMVRPIAYISRLLNGTKAIEF